MTRTLRRLDAALLVAGFATAFGVVAGFFGGYVRLLDTLAQFRGHLTVVLVVLALALIARRFFAAGFSALLAVALGLQSVLPFVRPQADQPGVLPPSMPRYSLLQMNLRFDVEDKAKAIRRILDLDPDVVTLEEVTPQWQSALRAISDRYPYQAHCSHNFVESDVAIYARRPFMDGSPTTCDSIARFEARTIDFDGHPVTIGVQHLRWPYPGRQWRQLAEIEPVLANLPTPLVVAGDFNSTPWSAVMQRYTSAGNLRIVAGIGPTFAPLGVPDALRRLGGLPIDHVLVSSEVLVLSATRPAATASDHLPLLVTFAIPFPRSAEPQVQSVDLR